MWPPICLLTYWLISESLDPTISAMKFLSACQQVYTEVTGVSFVDDTGLGVTSDYVHNPLASVDQNQELEILQVIHILARLAQHWEWLLLSTGGALNLNKSFRYLIPWSCKNGIPHLRSISQSPGSLPLTVGTTPQPTSVPRIEPSTSFQTPGVHISRSGCQTKQFQILHNHTQQYYDLISSSSISAIEAFLSYFVHPRPKISYPLPCSMLTRDQFRSIQAPALASSSWSIAKASSKLSYTMISL